MSTYEKVQEVGVISKYYCVPQNFVGTFTFNWILILGSILASDTVLTSLMTSYIKKFYFCFRFRVEIINVLCT